MKYYIMVILLFLQFFIYAQGNGNAVLMPAIENRFTKLDKAFVEKDTLALQNLLHKDLTLGHSNGWMETKKDLLKTLNTGGVVYKSIKTIGIPEIFHQTENLITIRRNIAVNGVVKETEFEVQLNILGIWIFDDGKWQLLARQSVNRKQS